MQRSTAKAKLPTMIARKTKLSVSKIDKRVNSSNFKMSKIRTLRVSIEFNGIGKLLREFFSFVGADSLIFRFACN